MDKYKDLFWQLTIREIKARYKQSVLGFTWAVIVPLINLIVLSIVFSTFIRVPTDVPYSIFLFVGLIPWMFTANSISAATVSLLANSTLITKVKLPREILPISAISSKTIDLFLTSLVLAIFLFVFGVKIKLVILLLPLILLVHLLLIIGVSFILSATNVFFRDVENILGVFLTMWMYLTPILYPIDLVPEQFRILLLLNPMTGIIMAYRDVILYGNIPSLLQFGYSTIFSIFIFISGYTYFKDRSKYFADVI